ncbi:hypothetical protein D3C72_2047690 [compost metagenome]
MLLGPRMRSKCGLAAFSMARRSDCSRTGSRPDVMTMAARVPSAPSSRISAVMVAGGVQMMARSGAFGKCASLR